MKHLYRIMCLALITLMLSACTSTVFTATWKAPDAKPGVFQGKKVLAFVLAKDSSIRLTGEDTLAAELTKLGMQGIAGYTLVPDTSDEAKVKADLEKAGIVGIVTMRPVKSEKELVSYSSGYYGGGPGYGGYWGGGGYYGAGWGGAYGGTDIRTNTIVSVETLVFSLGDNKILWSGMTKTTNPSNVGKFIKEIVGEGVKEIQKAGAL
jgi:hypothetical protein